MLTTYAIHALMTTAAKQGAGVTQTVGNVVCEALYQHEVNKAFSRASRKFYKGVENMSQDLAMVQHGEGKPPRISMFLSEFDGENLDMGKPVP